SSSYKKNLMRNYPVPVYAMPVLKIGLLSEEEDSREAVDPEVQEKEGYERGFSAGEKAGLEMAEQKAAVLLDHLEQLFREVYSLKEKMAAEVEPQTVLLAVSIARKILQNELQTRPEVIEDLIKEGLKKISRSGQVTVRLNASLFERLSKKFENFQKAFPDLGFELDPQAPTGGAVIRTQAQEVRTDLDFQLANVVQSLRNQG
ncbi:MAG: FliH/SctL family protein, partial [Thermodesulfobacteriota bacterium]